MNIHVILNIIIAAGPVFLTFRSFDKKRIRPRWVRLALLIIALVGVTIGGIQLALEWGWAVPSDETKRRLDLLLSAGCGYALGMIVTLALSGQWISLRRTTQEMKAEPNQSPKPSLAGRRSG